MTEETNRQETVCIQLLLGIPLVVIIFYVGYVLSNSEWVFYPMQAFAIFILIGVSGVIVFLISATSVPSSKYIEDKAEYFVDDLKAQNRVYVIPTACPDCQTQIRLDRVLWADEFTPLCQECQSKLKLRIVDR